MDVWKHLRWSTLDNGSGVGATGTGTLLSAPGVLYQVRGVARTAAGFIALYDHTNLPQNPLGPLVPGFLAAADTYPKEDLGIPLQKGLYVSFSMGTGGLSVWAGWERQ